MLFYLFYLLFYVVTFVVLLPAVAVSLPLLPVYLYLYLYLVCYYLYSLQLPLPPLPLPLICPVTFYIRSPLRYVAVLIYVAVGYLLFYPVWFTFAHCTRFGCLFTVVGFGCLVCYLLLLLPCCPSCCYPTVPQLPLFVTLFTLQLPFVC